MLNTKQIITFWVINLLGFTGIYLMLWLGTSKPFGVAAQAVALLQGTTYTIIGLSAYVTKYHLEKQ